MTLLMKTDFFSIMISISMNENICIKNFPSLSSSPSVVANYKNTLKKPCFLIQPQGRGQNSCMSMYRRVFINKRTQTKASQEHFTSLMYQSDHWHVFSCEQAALRTLQSVRPSACHTFCTMFPSSYHEISGVITNDSSDVHAKGQGQRSRSQRSKPNLAVSGL